MNILNPVRRAIGSLIGFASEYIITPIKTLWGRWVSSTSSTQRNIPKPDSHASSQKKKRLSKRRIKKQAENTTQPPTVSLNRPKKPSQSENLRKKKHQDTIEKHSATTKSSSPNQQPQIPMQAHARKESLDHLFTPASNGLDASTGPVSEGEEVSNIVNKNDASVSSSKENLFVPSNSTGLTGSTGTEPNYKVIKKTGNQHSARPLRKESQDNLFVPVSRDVLDQTVPPHSKAESKPTHTESFTRESEDTDLLPFPPSIEDEKLTGVERDHAGFSRVHLSSASSTSSSQSVFNGRRSHIGSDDYDAEYNELTSEGSDSEVFTPPPSPVHGPEEIENSLQNQNITAANSDLDEDSDTNLFTIEDNSDSEFDTFSSKDLKETQETPKSIRKLSYDSADEAQDFPSPGEQKRKIRPQGLMRSKSVPSWSDNEHNSVENEVDVLKSLGGFNHPVRKTTHQELQKELNSIKEELENINEEDVQHQFEKIAVQSLGPEMLKALADENIISIRNELLTSDSESRSDEDLPIDSAEDIEVHIVEVDIQESESESESESERDSGIGTGSESEKDSSDSEDIRIKIGKSGNKEGLLKEHATSVNKILKKHNIPEAQWEIVKQQVLHELPSGSISKAALKEIVKKHASSHTSAAETMMTNTAALLGERRPERPLAPEDILELKNKLPGEIDPVTPGDIAALETLARFTPQALTCCEYNPHSNDYDMAISQQLASTREVLSQIEKKILLLHDIDSGQSEFWTGGGEIDGNPLIKDSVLKDLISIKEKLQKKTQALELIQDGDFRQIEKIAPDMEFAETVALDTLKNRIEQTTLELNELKAERDKHARLTPQWSAAKFKITLKKIVLNKLNEASELVKSARNSIELKPNEDGIVVDAVKQLKKHEKKIADIMNSADLKKEYELNKTVKLNETYTGSIAQDIPIQVDGVIHQIHTTAKPAHQARFTLDGEDGGHEPYKKVYGGTIRNSATKNDSDHARNFYVQTTTDEDGNTIEKVYRLGIPTRFWEDKIKKEDIETVWKEVLVTQICETHKQIPGFKDAIDQGKDKAITLPLSYMCLLSPDMFRKVTGLHENEHMMAEMAIDTLMEMSEKPLELEIRESHGEVHKIWVKPDPLSFIMPLNQLAFSKTQKHLLRTFELADRHNKASAIKLFGDLGRKPRKGRTPEILGGSVGKYLAEHPDISSLEKEQIIAISTEMARVIHNKLYHKGGVRPNYLGWLQQELCRLTRRNYVTGCKSGKDRTGNACTANTVESAEAHFRMKNVDKSRQAEEAIPSQKEENVTASAAVSKAMNFGTDLRTQERILNMNTALYLSPSLGITRNCVGFPGLKCDDTALGVNSPQLVHIKN